MCLKTRKNRPWGARILRTCWCGSCMATCPVHVLGHFFRCTCLCAASVSTPFCICVACRTFPAGCKPFSAVSSKNGNTQLRLLLSELGVQDAIKHRSHDLRRGHSRDIMVSGADKGVPVEKTMEELRGKGQWNSNATPKRPVVPIVALST